MVKKKKMFNVNWILLHIEFMTQSAFVATVSLDGR